MEFVQFYCGVGHCVVNYNLSYGIWLSNTDDLHDTINSNYITYVQPNICPQCPSTIMAFRNELSNYGRNYTIYYNSPITTIYNKRYLDKYSKYWLIKKQDSFFAEDMVKKSELTIIDDTFINSCLQPGTIIQFGEAFKSHLQGFTSLLSRYSYTLKNISFNSNLFVIQSIIRTKSAKK